MAELGRRAFLAGSAAAAGLVVARGLGVHGLAAPAPAASTRQMLRDLAATFTARQRSLIVLPADHPSRQVTNAITFLDRPHLGTLLSPSQQVLARRLVDTMLSERGRAALAPTFAVEGRFDGCVLAIYGEPETGDAEATLMGGHVQLRGGVLGSEPLGGGVSYGHQTGNGLWRLPGNSFASHNDAANRLFAALGPTERTRAVERDAPVQLVLQPQAAGGTFDGVRVGSLAAAGRAQADALLETVLGLYPAASRAAAREAIDGNGGLDALHVAVYESHGFYEDMRPIADLDADERAARGDPYWQVWRIEGPGTVIHFQGYPHVHAYVQIVRDPARWSVGESLGRLAAPIEGEAMRELLEAALRRATGEALAWHHPSVPGRFCPGEITSGLAWTLDPYGNRVAVATIEGRAMAAPLRERLEAGGAEIGSGERHRVATSEFYASDRETFGEPDSIELTDQRVGEALVEHLRASGIEA